MKKTYEYCNKHFKFRFRHIKYTCKKNKDEDLKELVKLMNIQLTEHKNMNQEFRNELMKREREIEKRDKQIENDANL